MKTDDKMNLAFADLSFSVSSKLVSREKKCLLSNIYGDFRPGEFTGIMVSTDSEKCILMDILAGFETSGVTGTVQIDGQQRNLLKFHHTFAYVTGKTHFQPQLSVQETMHIAANLKLKMSNADKRQVINIIMRELSLNALRKTYVKNLSSSQRKRLSVALVLISNPPIIFFENPTSGLDNTAAWKFMGLLKSLAREGRTVVCMLERPSAKIVEKIDHLYVLGYGRCMYAGSPRNLVCYLENLGLRCPKYHNPADYLLELINDKDHVTKFVASSKNGRCENWRFARNANEANEFKRIDIASRLPSVIKTVCCTNLCCFYKLKQIRALIEYNVIKLSRDRALTYLRLSINFLMALVIGILYYGIGQDEAYISINIKMLFLTQAFLIFSSFYTALITFPSELPILKREYSNGWYKIHSYYLINRLADLPVQVTASAIYVIVIYFLTGQLLAFQRIRLFLISCILVSLVAQTFGVIIGINFSSQTATIIGPAFIMPSILLSGFFIPIHHVHSCLRWVFNLSFCKYGFEEIMAAIYGLNKPASNYNDLYQEFNMPPKIANQFGLEQLNYWVSAFTLVGLYVVTNLIAYICLNMRLQRRR